MKKLPKVPFNPDRPFNKQYPPLYGTLGTMDFDKKVDHRSFPKCDNCNQPIYNPEFYDCVGMCGPCTTGEADTIMMHPEDVDMSIYADMPNPN